MIKTKHSLIHKFYLFPFIALSFLLFTACSNQGQNMTVTQETPSVTLLPTKAEDNALISDTKEQSSVSDSPTNTDTFPINQVYAKTLILKKIDISKYTVELMNDSLMINEKVYYNFLVSENYTAYSPSLIVDKKTGEVFCYAADGTISPFSEFPLYIKDEDMVYNWNGTFTRYDISGAPTAAAEFSPADAHSFAFCLSGTVGFDTHTLNDVTEIDENTAVYSLSDTAALYFVLYKDTLILSYWDTSSDNPYQAAYDGIYYLDGSAPSYSSVLSETDAIHLLSGLSQAETALPEEISQYMLISDKLTINIKGYLCYSISAYTNLAGRKMLMNTYYVALDGSIVFMFDSSIADDVIIYSAS